jgi:hypothetical protein
LFDWQLIFGACARNHIISIAPFSFQNNVANMYTNPPKPATFNAATIHAARFWTGLVVLAVPRSVGQKEIFVHRC